MQTNETPQPLAHAHQNWKKNEEQDRNSFSRVCHVSDGFNDCFKIDKNPACKKTLISASDYNFTNFSSFPIFALQAKTGTQWDC